MNASDARKRNFIVMRLRGIYATFSSLTIGNSRCPIFLPEEIKLGQEIIDAALVRLGAKTDTEKRAEFRAKFGI